MITHLFHYRLSTSSMTRYQRSPTNLQCPHVSRQTALHIFLGCRHQTISSLINERHHIAF